MHDLAKVPAVEVRGMRCGEVPLFLIAGSCSFQKDNRSAAKHCRGPGLALGLELLVAIRDEFGLPVLSDDHYPEQAASSGAVAVDAIIMKALGAHGD